MTNLVRNYLPKSRFAAVAAAFLLALCAGLLVSAPPAAAHDELTGSTPGNGAVVDTAPESVELTFSNVPAAIGSEVRVLDEEGTDWAEGQVRILDNTATQQLRPGAPAGSYTVQWRVVSSDAHPIEGTFGFTVAGGGGTATDTGTAAPSTAAPLPPAASQSPVLNQSADAGSPWPVVVPAAVVLLAVAVLIALIVRRRLRED
ncbi:copper resistance CopC family protein [Arthrobacter sp. zg-Y1110]|uniref:copper resistance CopC family protein n=1 Tax=Arthrobacter sp. zg-Y1110 TaxID=2886932 RepID=UPI001D1558A0|nr:copper resistance CopC family protein [Arthrobacter sp. zg-Y1110]MCC3289411.1 copper resistance protein CopC [Arthrobacter sp. zg-Y1110]UWX85144.1 copper resistance protein CopC [Arthrobacter sp. zg-Y1110]